MIAKKCFLIVNPSSGGYSEPKIAGVMTILRQHGWSPDLLLTGSAADAPLLAGRICAEVAAPVIIAGGGDGTINGILNGLVPGQAILGILPLGTANVLAKELQIGSLEDAVQKIVREETRPLSVGLVEAQGRKKYFSLMAGIGIDGAVVKGMRLSEKKILGKGAYFLAALRQLAAWDLTRLEIRCDGQVLDCHSAIVCNGAKYGGEFILAPGADIFAPGFQVLCVRDGRRRSYLKLALTLLAGRAQRGEATELVHAREIEIYGRKAVQVDGDYYCEGPLAIFPIEGFVKIIV